MALRQAIVGGKNIIGMQDPIVTITGKKGREYTAMSMYIFPAALRLMNIKPGDVGRIGFALDDHDIIHIRRCSGKDMNGVHFRYTPDLKDEEQVSASGLSVHFPTHMLKMLGWETAEIKHTYDLKRVTIEGQTWYRLSLQEE